MFLCCILASALIIIFGKYEIFIVNHSYIWVTKMFDNLQFLWRLLRISEDVQIEISKIFITCLVSYVKCEEICVNIFTGI